MNLDRCVEEALRMLEPQVRQRFATAPQKVLVADLHLTVRPVDRLVASREEGGSCDGVSFLDDGVILYAPTPNSRRENFTLAHELGHWLIEQAEGLYDWIADQDDPARLLETLCDRIAQKLLLSHELISVAVQGEPVRAEHVLLLFDLSTASLPVCAIALADRLPNLGAVVILNSEAEAVASASIKPDHDRGWPKVFPWPGEPLPPGHPLTTMDVRSPRGFRQKTYWRNRWGAQEPFYVDALPVRGQIVAVFSSVDLWAAEQLHLDPARDFDRRPSALIRCCGEDRAVRGFPCSDCGRPFCPQCGRCHCQRMAVREQLCAGSCFMQFQPHLLVGGLCEECRD